MAFEPRWMTGDHPSPEQLLLAREDELPREEAEPILAHIHQCWECGTRVERYKRGIDTFMNFRKLHLDPAVVSRPEAWLRLAARLRQAGDEPEPRPEPFWKRVPRAVWVGLPAVAAAAALVLALILSPARLTATVVLERALRAEASAKVRPAVERVRVRRAGKLLPADDRMLRAAYIERARPLSVNSFRRWHDGLRTRQDSVTTVASEIRVETTTPEGTIALARLTVARRDFTARAKHVELRDGITIDVETVEGGAVAPETAPEATAPTTDAAAPTPDSAADTGEREALEMEVRWALHQIGADLGEALAIEPRGDKLVIRGTLDDETRRDQIAGALGGFPNVSAQLNLAVPDVKVLAKARPIESGETPTGAPLLAAQLRKNQPDPEARRVFVSGALEASQDILRHSWALRRLAQRYSVTAEGALSAELRASLSRLVAEHQDAIGAAARKAASLWQPYVELDIRSGSPRLSWQEASRRILKTAQSFDHVTARLLAASAADGLTQAEALERLRQSAQQLMSLLTVRREEQ
jgi:hypothetical protein